MYSWKSRYLYAVGVLTLSLIALLLSFHTVRFVYNRYATTPFFEEHYVKPESVEIRFPTSKRNLIYIYLESMENTVASRANGGSRDQSLIPELEALALAPNTITFSNSNHVLGGPGFIEKVSYSMAGLVAQNGGIPFFPENVLDVNDFTGSQYLPGMFTLGDVLHREGYNQSFLVGANAKFGRLDLLFKQHGDYKVIDSHFARNQGLVPPDYRVYWGYEDSKLFNFARDEIATLAKQDSPFNVQLFTANTHHPDGFIESDCPRRSAAEYDDAYLCSSKQVASFVAWAQQQPWADHTTIILAGDHLGMRTGYYEAMTGGATKYQRTPYYAILNSAVPVAPQRNRNRVYTELDQYPTTLTALGATFSGDRLALGTNLFSDTPTLAEKLGGVDVLNQEFLGSSDFYERHIQNKRPG